MSEIVTLELPESVAHQARAIAAHTHRAFEEVLIEWLDQAANDVPLELLPDDEILALRDSFMEETQQVELSNLLSQQRENDLDAKARVQLDLLMGIYRRGLLRKAQALKIAVERNLQPPLN